MKQCSHQAIYLAKCFIVSLFHCYSTIFTEFALFIVSSKVLEKLTRVSGSGILSHFYKVKSAHYTCGSVTMRERPDDGADNVFGLVGILFWVLIQEAVVVVDPILGACSFQTSSGPYLYS